MSDRAEIDRRTFLRLAAGAGLVGACGVSALDAGTECTVKGKRMAKPEDGDIGDMRYPQARAYLSNNPRWHRTFRNPVAGVEIPVKAFPVLAVEFRDLPRGGSWQIGATVFGEGQDKLISLEATAASQDGRIHKSWELGDPLSNAWTVHVWARQDSYRFEETTGLRVYRLSGRVTDFDGKPIEAVVCANGVQGVAAPTDRAGRYDLWLPDRHIPSLLAADAGYGKSTLQCWVYDYRPQDDLALDMRVGQIELYELHAWRGYGGLKVDFIPMSVAIVNALFGQGKKPGSLKSVGPELSPDDISVEVDGTAARILSVHTREEITRREAAAEMPFESRPEYSLQVADPGCSPGVSFGNPQVLRVAVRHHFKESGRSSLEQGEGFYLGLRSGVGYSGGTTQD